MTREDRPRRASTFAAVRPPRELHAPIDGLALENLRILEAVYHEAALMASEDPSPPTSEELEDEAALAEFVRELMRRR